VVAKLAAVLLEAAEDPGITARLAEIGAEPWPLGTEAYNDFMRAEVARWAPIVAASGATVD
jgi:tripartite-type tricarboxylate transporter receptor subunit TctC